MNSTTWNNLHGSLMLIASLLFFVFSGIEILIIVAFISFGLLVWNNRTTFWNWANIISLARFVLISLVMGQSSMFTSWQLFILLGFAVLMDLLDGYIARKTNSSSELGFLLDLEVDAYFVLVMSFYYYHVELIPFWILLPGMMRYLFKLVTLIWPKPKFEESKKWYASVIAGMYFVILLIALIVPKNIQFGILFIGGIGIVFSFGISFIEYFRWKEK